jgi:hypothetical protein
MVIAQRLQTQLILSHSQTSVLVESRLMHGKLQ